MDTDVTIDEQGRPEPPVAAGEVESLIGFLDYQRATLEWKCSGLDAGGLRATVAPSSITLGGLLKHMCFAEDHWFSKYLHGNERHPPFDTVDWEQDPDWEWKSAADDGPDDLRAMWHDFVNRSRSLLDAAMDGRGVDQLAQRSWPNGRAPSLRWILLHMIEEYARHNGHADFLRESVDGLTGE